MAELKSYSTAEISLHTTKQSCWLSIGGKVYDVTTFMEEHPGGEDVMLHASASGDATQAFEEVGHSSSAISSMKSYLIGTVEGHVSDDQKPPKPTAASHREPPPPSYSLSDYFLPLLVLAVAFAAWYYLTFYSKTKA
ncbi:cytochrome b5-like [Zingiber officinale]|uniref:cytochrome b5-like n=1 Tax=Zingiber officinale TaxID=94328 RepID=UPI001C4A80D9|nr:cytochrome b5-like [Zingiber officinale]